MQTEGPIVYYDGVCNLCNKVVQFIIKHDKSKRIMFASLQSAAGQKALHKLLQQHATIPDSIVLYEHGKYYIQSSAALRIGQLMGYPKAVINILNIVPVGIRDAIYNVIARNRYKWFGRSESCPLPTKEQQKRMINE